MTAIKKRVATLYRVSSKGQLDGNDIPMQRRACNDYISTKQNWVLVKEYIEKGVSGFKVAASERDVIQQAKEDAEKGIYDILLVFMFDRLGRRDDETPFVLEWFVNNGIEMWSVVEGQQKIEQHTDRLINYIRFWQSSGESRKTSERVSEKHKQMVEDGIYRGGGVPYGYSTEKSGRYNKKGKELLKLVIDEEESQIVKLIYSLAHDEGYGQLRIAKYLNEEVKVRTRNGNRWIASTINVILKNPIYKGVMRYRGKKEEVYSDPIPELIIINPTTWNNVQEMRRKRATGDENTPISTKGKLLLIGMARCGVCGSRMTSTTFVNKHRDRSGVVKKYNKYTSYRCSGKLQSKTNCTGQSTYSSNKVDKHVLKLAHQILDSLEQINYADKIKAIKEKHESKFKKDIKATEAKIKNIEKELSILNSEVTKSILGESSFKPELLNNLIEEKNQELRKYQQVLAELIEIEEDSKSEVDKIAEVQRSIPVWRDVFSQASNESKRVILSKLFHEVYISKEEIRYKLNAKVQDILLGT